MQVRNSLGQHSSEQKRTERGTKKQSTEGSYRTEAQADPSHHTAPEAIPH